MDPNSNFLCPITSQLMSDPVIDRDGNTYERTAIEEWLSRNGTSPITRNAMTAHDLTPNRVLRSAIEEFKRTAVNAALEAAAAQAKNAPEAVSDAKHVMEAKGGDSKHDSGSLTDLLPDLACSYSFKLVSSADGRDEYQCLFKVESHEVAREHVPSDIVLVIDVSGSMGNEAKTQSVESSGLSLLDIVKHGVKTIINTLGPNDRLAVVSFSNRASISFNLTVMDGVGKSEAIDKLNELSPEGMTNLWDGLLVAMDLLKNRSSFGSSTSSSQSASRARGGRNSAILLLTDGEPNIEPPRGHLPMLRKYRESNGGAYPGVVSTFGFGYSLDSKLLTDIALEASGSYAFIPDSGFVGTVFVNALANILATVGTELTVDLLGENGVRFVESNICTLLSPNKALIVRGSIQYGQSADTLFSFSVPAGTEVDENTLVIRASYYPRVHDRLADLVSLSEPICFGSEDAEMHAEIDYHSFRYRFVDCIGRVLACMSTNSTPDLSDLAIAQEMVKPLVEEMRAWLAAHAGSDPMGARALSPQDHHQSAFRKAKFLLDDLAGQVSQAVSRLDWFRKWGKHFLPALSRAHEIQQCVNFKDPGVQHFGGRLFRLVRDNADDVFCSLPAPQPARPILSFAQLAAAQAGKPVSSPVVDMSTFNDASNPCFHEDCVVSVLREESPTTEQQQAIGSAEEVTVTDEDKLAVLIPISQLKRGDKLVGGGTVLCVLKTLCARGVAELIELPNGLKVTPYHPINVSASAPRCWSDVEAGDWRFPIDVWPSRCRPQPMRCGALYSIVLRADCGNSQSFLVNGYQVIALGHGVEAHPVLSHVYLGQRDGLVKDLSSCAGWNSEDGVIVFAEGCMIRGPESRSVEEMEDTEVSKQRIICGLNYEKEISCI